MKPSDAELMERWQRGDPAAFAALVERWQQPITRFLARLGNSPGQVSDLCQEVFLRLYESASRYREQGGFSPWLYRIALNVARDAARRQRRQPAPLPDCEPPANGLSPDAACARREVDALVARAVAGLPEPQRLVVVLRHYEGMNFEEIARLTGTPASTLKSRFAVALAQLRERLRPLAGDLTETTP